MPQHIATVVSIVDLPVAEDAVMRWWDEGEEFPVNQTNSPWLMYWGQWYDPWLSSYEYYERLKGNELECSQVKNGVVRIATSKRNIEILKK